MRAIQILLCLVSGLALFIAVFSLLVLPEMVRGDEAFKVHGFEAAIQFVENHKAKTGRVPSFDIFEQWKLASGQENRALFLQTTGSMASQDCPFGSVPSGSYGISDWRGEWFDCYAAWEKAYSFDQTVPESIAFSAKATLVFLVSGLFARSLSRR
jgi:hypothetical protein